MGLHQQPDSGGTDTVINKKVVGLGFPIYVVWAVLIEIVFGSGNPASNTRVPVWMVVAFCVTAVVAAILVLSCVVRRKSGRIPEDRQRAYWALLVAIFVAGIVETAAKGAATLLLGGHPWWVLVPVFAVGYAAGWATLAVMLTRDSETAPPA